MKKGYPFHLFLWYGSQAHGWTSWFQTRTIQRYRSIFFPSDYASHNRKAWNRALLHENDHSPWKIGKYWCKTPAAVVVTHFSLPSGQLHSSGRSEWWGTGMATMHSLRKSGKEGVTRSAYLQHKYDGRNGFYFWKKRTGRIKGHQTNRNVNVLTYFQGLLWEAILLYSCWEHGHGRSREWWIWCFLLHHILRYSGCIVYASRLGTNSDLFFGKRGGICQW